MKFAFVRTVRTKQTAWFEAETELEAWAKALDGAGAASTDDEEMLAPPLYRRAPKLDEFDL